MGYHLPLDQGTVQRTGPADIYRQTVCRRNLRQQYRRYFSVYGYKSDDYQSCIQQGQFARRNCGKNTGSVSGCNVGTGKTALVLKSNASDILAGGIAGSNSGTIEGTKKAYSTVYAQLGFVQTDMAYYGNLGGIAGSNTGRSGIVSLTETYRGQQIIRRMHRNTIRTRTSRRTVP